jgi:hypothetical protein
MLLSFAVHGHIIFDFQPNGQSDRRLAEASFGNRRAVPAVRLTLFFLTVATSSRAILIIVGSPSPLTALAVSWASRCARAGIFAAA